MERKIKLENIVSSIDFYDHNSMNKIVNLVIEIESDYYFIEDEFDKIIDITQMHDITLIRFFILECTCEDDTFNEQLNDELKIDELVLV